MRWSSEATHSDTIAPTTSAPSNDPYQLVANSVTTASRRDRLNNSLPNQRYCRYGLLRAIIHVNMHAKRAIDQAVVIEIPEGSPLEVVNCHQWCEVIFAGRRGWVYQGFIGP